MLCSFAGAYDWANTSETAFAPVVYFNDTFSMPDDGSDIGNKYTRKPQLLNMAVNSWMATVLGESGSMVGGVRIAICACHMLGYSCKNRPF